MSEPPHQPPPRPLSELPYDTPVGVGQVRTYSMGEGRLTILIGPPAVGRQILAITPTALLFGFLCSCIGLLTVGVVVRPGAIPYNKLLFVPTLVALVFSGLEMVSTFRNWSQPARIEVDGPSLRVPYPLAQSKPEEIPVRLVRHLRLKKRRSRILRKQVESLEIGLEHGPRILLFSGYPHETLEKLTDVLGPALGLAIDEAPRS